MNRWERVFCAVVYFVWPLCGVFCKELSIKEPEERLHGDNSCTRKKQGKRQFLLRKRCRGHDETAAIVLSDSKQVINASVLPGRVQQSTWWIRDAWTADRRSPADHQLGLWILPSDFPLWDFEFGTDTSKVKQWYSILTTLLYVVEPAIDSPVKIQQGIDEIQHYLKQDSVLLPIMFR